MEKREREKDYEEGSERDYEEERERLCRRERGLRERERD